MAYMSPALKYFYSMQARRSSRPVTALMDISEIDWSSLAPIGCGAYGAVFGNTRYAVKIGKVFERAVAALITLQNHELAVPVYGYYRGVDKSAIPFDKDTEIVYMGDTTSIRPYLRHKEVDVLIMARAKPALNPKYSYTHLWNTMDEKRYCQVSDFNRLKKKVSDVGVCWDDDHMGNFGYWNKQPVVLDL
jgi:hypothetical protein